VLELARVLAGHLYRRNRARLYRRVLGRREGPWMLPHEEDLILELLRRMRPTRCLEWGAGGSTLRFPAELPEGATWLAIEHDRGWADAVAAGIRRPGVRVAHVPPDRAWAPGDGTAEEFAAYLAHPASLGPFDFILVDGRARAAALAACGSLLAGGGVVVLHDANRPAYARVLPDFPHRVLFQDRRRGARRPAGGVWIGSPDRPVHALLDVAWHRRVWRFYGGTCA
jgi:predicted O-methyltransferase YrrM